MKKITLGERPISGSAKIQEKQKSQKVRSFYSRVATDEGWFDILLRGESSLEMYPVNSEGMSVFSARN